MSYTRRLPAILPALLFLVPFVEIRGASAGESCVPGHSAKPVAHFTGVASWYGREYQGKKTASGEPFDRNDLTAAHPFLPMQATVCVVDLETGRSVTVRINDRGPGPGRAIDLSQAAARRLGMEARGIARVRIEEIAEGTE